MVRCWRSPVETLGANANLAGVVSPNGNPSFRFRKACPRGDASSKGSRRYSGPRPATPRTPQSGISEVSKRQQVREFSDPTARNPANLFANPAGGFRATVKSIVSPIPNFNEDVDKRPGAMVGSEIVGSLNAGERKYENEDTLFWGCVGFWCFHRRERGDDTRASRHDRQRGHQSCRRMRTGILARAGRTLSPICCRSRVPARVSPWPRGPAVLAQLNE
jgi:hypothetical protein